MSIYLDISAFVHRRAGLGRYAGSLAQALVEQYPGRISFFYNRENRESADNLPPHFENVTSRTVRAGYKPWRMAAWMGQLAHLDFGRLMPGAELYHATEHLLMPLPTIPTVLTVHDLIYHLLPAYHKKLNYWYLNLAMPLFCKRASAIIAVSESTREDMVRAYGIPPEKIHVVYEAPAPHFTPSPPEKVEEARRRYNLPPRYIVTVGTIEPRKNLSRLLGAFAMLYQYDPQVQLVVVGGRGWLYEDFFATLESLPCRQAVRLTGHVPDEDLPAILSGATLCAIPSLYEGFGLGVIEAQACGTPVVCSKVSSLPEVGGEAAAYFSPYDEEEMAEALKRVWKDSYLQRYMSRKGLAHASGFSWQKAAAHTMEVYRSVLR